MFYCEIISGLWVGDVNILMNQKFIEDNDIGIIFNCTSTFQSIQLNTVHNVRLPFTDTFDSPKDVELLKTNKKKLCDYLKKNLLSKNILICCFDGKTVSPLICALYLYQFSKIDKKSIYPILLRKEKTFKLWMDLSLFE